MICPEIDDFSAALPPHLPIIGLDLGEKTIGVALSDRLWSVATPQATVKRRKFGVDAARLLEIAASREAGGSEGPRCQSTRAFARNLEKLTDLPIGFWDERLSTAAAERALIEADLTRKRRAEVIDAVAAAYILQGALDRLRHMRAGT